MEVKDLFSKPCVIKTELEHMSNKELIDIIDYFTYEIKNNRGLSNSQIHDLRQLKKCLDCDKLVTRRHVLCRSCSSKRRGDISKENLKEYVGLYGKEHPRYKNGISSYRKLVKLNECSKCKSKDRLVVHHIDENRHNNDINNLDVLCYSCHAKIHFKEKKRDSLGKFVGVKKWI